MLTLREVEWSTLAFFAGLFIMVGGLVQTGVIGTVSEAAAHVAEGRTGLAAMLLLWASAALSAIVDNIPYVATMSPVVADLAHQAGPDGNVLWWALALGADLGGNATAVGASANVVALGIAEREGQRISFWEFSRYGLPVTLITVALAVPYLWLRYLLPRAPVRAPRPAATCEASPPRRLGQVRRMTPAVPAAPASDARAIRET